MSVGARRIFKYKNYWKKVQKRVPTNELSGLANFRANLLGRPDADYRELFSATKNGYIPLV